MGYRIYRRFSGDAASTFELVRFVPAQIDSKTQRETPGYLYTVKDDDGGKGLLNDQVDGFGRPVPYLYRLTVVDADGTETPDPAAPPKEEVPLRVWPTSRVSPSEAPPPPNVRISVADLVARLTWQDYTPPGDAVAYRVYARLVTDGTPPQLDFIKEIPISATIIGDAPGQGPSLEYIDTDYARDMMTKEYLVTVLDKFGVESEDTPATRRRAQVPNLPPAALRWRIVDAALIPAGIQINFRWDRPRERDISGYNIYSRFDGPWRLRKTVGDPSQVTASVVETSPFLPEYFITAFDNTNRDDGNFDQIYPPE